MDKTKLINTKTPHQLVALVKKKRLLIESPWNMVEEREAESHKEGWNIGRRH